jgi:hypothetical protein
MQCEAKTIQQKKKNWSKKQKPKLTQDRLGKLSEFSKSESTREQLHSGEMEEIERCEEKSTKETKERKRLTEQKNTKRKRHYKGNWVSRVCLSAMTSSADARRLMVTMTLPK